MLSIPRFFQVEFRSAADDLHLELDIVLQGFLERHNLRLTVMKCEHNHADGILQLSIAKQLIEHHLRIGFLFQIDDDTHTVSVRFVVQRGYRVNLFIFYQLGNLFDQPRFIDHIRNFGNNDAKCAVLSFLNFGTGAERNLSAAGRICGTDSGSAHNNAAGREVGAFDAFHDFIQRCFGIINQQIYCINHFPQIMGRDIGSHTDRDTGTAVYQQVRITGWQNRRLLQSVIIV